MKTRAALIFVAISITGIFAASVVTSRYLKAETERTPEVVAMEQRLQQLRTGDMVISKDGDVWVAWRPTEQKRMFLRSIQGQQFNNEERSMYTWAWTPSVVDIVHRDDPRWEQEAIRLVERMTRPNYDFEPSSSQPAETSAP